MSDIRCEVEAVGTRLLVTVRGELCLSTAATVRTTLLKCLAEQPDAVVVDVAAMVVTAPAATTLFIAAARQASLWPGTPLVIAAPDPRTARMLRAGCGRLAVHPSLAEAFAAEPRRRMPSLTETLLPVIGAARHARRVVAEACEQWSLPHLTGPASVVTGELVTNAVEHAQTMIDLRLTLGLRSLQVAVRDGSPDEPVRPARASAEPAAPRGLLLVDAMSYRWGSLPAAGGKVVWAILLSRGPTGAGLP